MLSVVNEWWSGRSGNILASHCEIVEFLSQTTIAFENVTQRTALQQEPRQDPLL